MLSISTIASIAAAYTQTKHALVDTGMYFATSCNGFDGEGCEVCFWDRRQLKQIWQCTGHQQATKACVFLPTASKRLEISNYDNEQKDSASAAAAIDCLVHSECSVDTKSLTGMRSSVLLASASADCTVKVWEMGRDEPVCTATPHRWGEGAMLTCLALCSVAQNGSCDDIARDLLFAGDFHGQLHTWDVQQLCQRQTRLEPMATIPVQT